MKYKEDIMISNQINLEIVTEFEQNLKEIYQTQELEENSTIRNFRIVQNEGNRQVKREVIFYNLDAIIAVGYRVNSKQATQLVEKLQLKLFIIEQIIMHYIWG